ncbi:pseudaminic acid synthase [Eubacterium sp. MSJ-33]|nr:pseudaminic acid synthase [Eubacterium sp. MSJ-33]QWT52160.1 pseudaminic acid synthase [Eubacterium sp. MSJ-33]
MQIGKNYIGQGHPTYIVAEMSANHNMDFERAKAIIKAAAQAGADAIKIQTYTPDTITIESDKPAFRTKGIWEGRTLYELYGKAYTPWEWQEELQTYAHACGIDFFSSPFDLTAVDFLENLHVPAYKVASFEINDIPFIRKIAKTGKPIIMSTGIAYLEDIDLAVRTCLEEGNDQVILLKCISSYPAPYENMNLNVIPNMKDTFDCICGLSDHSMGTEIAVAAVALGAKVIEKHFTLCRADGGEDSQFSMEPQEFKSMVQQIRNVEKALGTVTYALNDAQIDSRIYSRSLFVVKDIKQGEVFTPENVRSIRPGIGMHTKHWDEILGKHARCDIEKGTPMDWKYVE